MHELETAVTEKGQVTIPVAIRRLLGLKPKDRVRFEIDGGKVTLRPSPSQIRAGFGAVVGVQRAENWREVREKTELAIAEDVVGEG